MASQRNISFPWLVMMAEAEVERLRRELPAEVAGALEFVPVVLEARPSEAAIKTGLDPDLLGLFEGAAFGEEAVGEPPRIVLWLENLWDYSEEDLEIFRDEVGITLLHELGHYLGWDEEDLEARELD